MCNNCGMIQIDEDVLDTIILSSNLTLKELEDLKFKQATTDKPTFKPDKNKGEGKAGKQELDYRKDLIGLISVLYKPVEKIVKSDTITIDQKTNQVDNLVNVHFNSGPQIIDKHTTNIFDSSSTDANDNMAKLKKDMPEQTPNPNKIDPLTKQQTHNLKDIGNTLVYKINQGLMIDDLKKSLNEEYEPDYDYLNTSFNNAQDRLDALGWFGWFYSDKLGLISTYLLGQAILGELVADWLTCEDTGDCSSDGPVCDECLDLAANGPYPIANWPLDPHLWCRCSQGPVYLAPN